MPLLSTGDYRLAEKELRLGGLRLSGTVPPHPAIEPPDINSYLEEKSTSKSHIS